VPDLVPILVPIVKSDGPESEGASDGRVDLGEGEGRNGPSDPRVLIYISGCNGTASREGTRRA